MRPTTPPGTSWGPETRPAGSHESEKIIIGDKGPIKTRQEEDSIEAVDACIIERIQAVEETAKSLRRIETSQPLRLLEKHLCRSPLMEKKKGGPACIAHDGTHIPRESRCRQIDPQPSDGYRLLDLNRGRAFPGARESYLNRISAGVHFFTLIMTKSLVKVVTNSSFFFFNFSVNTEKAHLWLKSHGHLWKKLKSLHV